jgi:putative transposase
MRDRDYKIFRAGHFYHVFNRGNNKQTIFFEDTDYLKLLKCFKLVLGFAPAVRPFTAIRPLPKDAFSIAAYCLMPNHFHFLIRQNTDLGINKLMQKVCTSYAAYINKKYNRVGGLFQDQFKAKLVDNDTYAKYLSAYIHNNPGSLDWDYSSYKDIIGLRGGQLADRGIVLSWFNDSVVEYERFVERFTEKDKQQIQDLLFED